MSKSLAEHLSEVRRAIPFGYHPQNARANTTAPITDEVDLSTYRPITLEERALLTALLLHGGPEGAAFLPQLEGMMVQLNCTCGCPSVSIAVARHHGRTTMRANHVVHMVGDAEEGLVGVILVQAGGKLVGLDVYSLSFYDKSFGLPAPETLQPF